MKKRLLLVAFALLTVATSFAFQAGDYAYNSTQRFKVTGDNLVTNGNFASGRDGWFGLDRESNPSAEVWDVVEGAGPNGETVLQSLGATADQPLCNSWKLDAGTYIVSFDLKYTAAGYTTIGSATKDGVTINSNCADFFLNGDASFIKAVSSDEAPVVNVAAQANFPAEEWKTIVFFFTAEQDQNLVMHFEKMAEGVQITNIEIHQAQEVYDVRIAQNRIAYAKELIENPNFNVEAAQEARASLQDIYVAGIEGMIEAGEFDDPSNAEGMMAEFETALEEYTSASSVNLKSLISGLVIKDQAYYGRGGIGSNAAKYHLELSGNWGHLNSEPDVLRSAIQNSYDHQATYTAYHEDLPAGKYYFTCEIRNANTDKTSWPTNPVFNLTTEGCKLFIGTDSVELAPISGEEFQRFSIVAEVPEGTEVRAGVYWPGVSSGGAFFLRNTEFRSFDLDALAKAEHIAAFKTYMTQWNAAVGARKNLRNRLADDNYPWDKQVLRDAQEKYDPYYSAQAVKGWSTEDGADAGIATTDELLDWANYQGIEEYSEPTEEGAEPTRLTYQLVRGYQNAVNTVVASNKPFTDLAEAIDAAKKTRNTGAYLTGDRDAYKAAIQKAIADITDIRKNTTDEKKEADTELLANSLAALNAATEAFLASVKIEPFVDIDFSTGFKEDTAEDAPAAYYIEGNKGRMYFAAYDEDNNNASGFALGVGEEYLDVLRVGNGSATVYIDEASQPGESDAVRVQFDMYHGNLTGKFAGVELQNEAGERVAGFYLNRYNGSLEFNDFNDVLTNGGTGMNILKYATGVGSSSASNAAIAAESNKSTYQLVIDYKNKTLQGTLINAKNGTCEGATMPFRTDIEDQKITKFVLKSNYNTKERRCWFDNLQMMKYALSDVSEDISESGWAYFDEAMAIKTVNTVATDAAIYTIGGVRVSNATKPGLYIQNGKKFVVK